MIFVFLSKLRRPAYGTARVALWSLVVLVSSSHAGAATIIVANRTGDKIAFEFCEPQKSPQSVSLASGELCSLTDKGAGTINYSSATGLRELPVNINSAYCFIEAAGKVEFREIGLSAKPPVAETRPAVPANSSARPATAQPATGVRPPPTPPTTEQLFPEINAPRTPPPAAATGKTPAVPPKKFLTIPVKILVDDDEQASSHVWKGRLARRIQAANAVFEKQCRVHFEIVAYEEWVSDNAIDDFNKSLTEFEHKVKPEPARLAIGFTSQYAVPTGQFHLGGTRGPLHSHILVREWSQLINEPERLEVLMHELGHYLGAVHSPAIDSSMRAILGDRQARAKDFRIGFDPVNVLAMSMVSEDMRARDIHSFAELSMPTQLRLNEIYGAMATAMPRDPTPEQFRTYLRVPQSTPGSH